MTRTPIIYRWWHKLAGLALWAFIAVVLAAFVYAIAKIGGWL